MTKSNEAASKFINAAMLLLVLAASVAVFAVVLAERRDSVTLESIDRSLHNIEILLAPQAQVYDEKIQNDSPQ